MAAEVTCRQFADYLSRKTEHLDAEILYDMHPTGSLIGAVETGVFPAGDGVSHTYDRFKNVFPDMSGEWNNVVAGSCIGTPCDMDRKEIGMGYVRDEYHLQRKAFKTALFCFDEIMSADRAQQQFSHIIENLRRATEIIQTNRIMTEMFRIAGSKWLCTMTGLVPFTFTDTGNLTDVVITGGTGAPTSKMVKNMLRSRVEVQRLTGALGKKVQGMNPTIEVLSDTDTIYNLCQGDSQTTDHWRYNEIPVGSKEFNQFGWTAQVGDFMLKGTLMPLRFQLLANGHLQQVFPFINVPATAGIGEIVNPQYLAANIQATFIWHRRAMVHRTRETMSVNPNMPFAARDFGGKWQWVQDNLSCGTVEVEDTEGNTVLIPKMVENPLRNKGQFLAQFDAATQAQYPEFAEVFLHYREPAVIVGQPLCVTPSYVNQSYNSANDGCEDVQ